MSTNYVPHPNTLAVTYTKLVGNQTDEDVQTGRTKPPLFTTESPQSIQLVVDGKTRTGSSDPFNFLVSLNNQLFRARMARVSKVVIPKPPNITQFNNRLLWRQWNGVVVEEFSVTLQPAFYNTTTLSNEIALKMTTEAGGSNIYVCAFDSVTRTFMLSYTYGAGVPGNFYVVNTCNFITRGEYLAPFSSQAAGLDPMVVGTSFINSGIAGMVYTRYAIVSSESFNQYSFSDSRATTLLLKNNIICIVDMTSVYDSEDYDVGTPYAGVYATVDTPEAPHIMVTNPQRNLNDRVDILVQDEYGEFFNELFNLGPTYPPNTIGISLWMEVSF
jgi:hypothetical protein